jgi:hypothetical protein
MGHRVGAFLQPAIGGRTQATGKVLELAKLSRSQARQNKKPAQCGRQLGRGYVLRMGCWGPEHQKNAQHCHLFPALYAASCQEWNAFRRPLFDRMHLCANDLSAGELPRSPTLGKVYSRPLGLLAWGVVGSLDSTRHRESRSTAATKKRPRRCLYCQCRSDQGAFIGAAGKRAKLPPASPWRHSSAVVPRRVPNCLEGLVSSRSALPRRPAEILDQGEESPPSSNGARAVIGLVVTAIRVSIAIALSQRGFPKSP